VLQINQSRSALTNNISEFRPVCFNYFKHPTDLKGTIREAKEDKDKFVKMVTRELKTKMTKRKSSS